MAGCNSADNAREVISSLCHQFDARNLFLNVQKSSKEMRIIFNHSGSNAIQMAEGIEVVGDLKVLGFTIESKFGFLSLLTKLLSNRILYFFQYGALVKSVIRRTNLLFCIVLLFSQSLRR